MRIVLSYCLLLSSFLCTLQAQSDVTGTYLTHAGFDDSNGWATSNIGSGALQSVTGWTPVSSGDTWYYGGAIGYASGISINGVTRTTGPDGSQTGGALALSVGWGCTAAYTQQVTLPAGSYRLTYDYYNANDGATQANNLIGIIESNGTTHYGSRTDFPSGQWLTDYTSFTLTSSQTVTLSVGIGAVSGGSGANAKLFIDQVSLLRTLGESKSDWNGSKYYTAHWQGQSYNGIETFQWAASLPLGERLGQTLTGLTPGTYRVELLAAASSTSSRDNTANVITDGDTRYVSLHANDASVAIPAYNRIAFDNFGHYTLTAQVGTEGTLHIYMNEDVQGPNWLVIYPLSFTRITDEDTNKALSLSYRMGDVNLDGQVTSEDIPVMADMVLGKTPSNVRAHLINSGDIDVSDLTELQNIILGNSSGTEVNLLTRNALLQGFVHAEQSASDNLLSAVATLTAASSKEAPSFDITPYVDMRDYLTTLHIQTSLSNVVSVSLYALDKAAISGPLSVDVTDGQSTFSYPASAATFTYAANNRSDVVTVTGTISGTCTAYLLPVALANGLMVTVRTSDGTFHSQTFSTIEAGKVNTLTLDAPVASNLWMSTLPGSTYFSLLSTPGAHDACTSSVSSTYASMAKCQDTNLAGLLARGVRAFDLRPEYTNNNASNVELSKLTIYHGYASTGVLFKDAIDILINFVKEHPSEAISILMQKENTKLALSKTDQSETWRASILECFKDASRSPYLRGYITGNETLDDLRGKVTIVSKNPYGTASNNYWDEVYGGIVSGWPDNASTTSAYIYYSWDQRGPKVSANDDYSTSSTDTKTTNVSNMLSAASDDTDIKRWYYTFISMADKPATYAKTMNPATVTLIQALDGHLGYVYGDYMGSTSNGGQAIVKAIIEQNYKYVYKGRSALNIK